MDSNSSQDRKQRLVAALSVIAEILLEPTTPVVSAATTTKRLIDKSELCEILGVTPPTIRKMERSGQLPFVQVGDCHRYDLGEVRAALAAQPRPEPKNDAIIRLTRKVG